MTDEGRYRDEQEKTAQRIQHQREQSDYDLDENNNPISCGDCGRWLNSRGHCPACDY